MNGLLPWFEEAGRRLLNADEEGRLAHALLLVVPWGWGAHNLVAYIARHLLQATATAEQVSQWPHPDLHVVQPDRAEIKVDDIRALNEFCQRTASGGARKLAVLESAQQMNLAAANALLKTLEEPTPGTHLLLVCEQPERLLPTVRSRCQRIPLHLDLKIAKQWLEQQQETAAAAFLEELGGAPLLALELSQAGQSPIGEQMNAIDTEKGQAALLTAVLEGDVSMWLARWYRTIKQRIAHAESVGERRWLLEFSDQLLDARRQLQTSNAANARLHLERLFHLWRGRTALGQE